jgi:hypothetical protein
MDVFEQSELKKQISVLYEASLKSEKIKIKVQKLYDKVVEYAKIENIKLSTFTDEGTIES